MEQTTRFFSKLKNLAVTLETETAKLQHVFENRNNEDGDGETTANAMRAYHELNCEVGNLKGQIRNELAQQKAQDNEVINFIKACRVMEQRVVQDIQTLKSHWEKYGYQAPCHPKRPTKPKGQEAEAEDEVADEDGTKSAEEEESQQEDGENHPSTPPKAGPPVTNVMQTPQLSDFGLSEIQLKRVLAGMEWCSEVPPMPDMRLPQPSLNTPAPPLPITPKCALRMDDDELHTPQMHDFGITEHTMCLNNDFTMNLFRKNVEKSQRSQSTSEWKQPPQGIPEPPVNSLMESLQAKADKLESPELPVLCTPQFKIKKTNGQCSSPEQGTSDPVSPCHPDNLPTTPEVPAFQTPYMKRLVSTKKSTQQSEPINSLSDDSHTFELPTLRNGATCSKRTRECDVPDMSIMDVEDKQMPEMPNLESVLGNSLLNRNAKVLKISKHENVAKDATVNSLELDGPTQEFSLGTPRIRTNYQEPSTPEMPDLSSVTQDICKLVSQAQLKKKATAIGPEKNRNSPLSRAVSLRMVSESEFQGLPSYLRQMTLHNLNQAVHSINKFTQEHRGEVTELQMEELKRIMSVGTKAPVYILCLTELKRLKLVGGVRNTSVFQLITHN